MKSDFSQYKDNPKNYRWGVYFCPEDPCVVRPKRNHKIGGTINFAHRLAIPTLIFFLLLATAPTYLVVGLRQSSEIIATTVVASVFLLCLMGAVLSDRPI